MIPVAKPSLDEKEVAAASEVILSGWVTQGPKVREFEEAFAEFTGARHACAVSSCTTALHLGLIACGVGPGDEVLTVSHSFIATANAVHYTGATPVFVDVDPDTFNIDPAKLEQALTDKTKAVLCVHQMGLPCDMQRILAFAAQHDLRVIEDAACAAGSEIHMNGSWDTIGKPHGDVACFSFHPRKILTTGDGGMVTTNDPAIDRELRLLRQHGMSISDAVRHGTREVVFEGYPVIGYNYRMTDIQASIGTVQLQKLPRFIEERRRLVALYTEYLAECEVILPHVPKWARPNWQSYCVRLPKRQWQKPVMQALLDLDIATRRGIMNAHQEGAYEPAGTCRIPEKLANSELARDTGVILPLFPGMKEAEVRTVAVALKKAVEDCRQRS